MSLSPNVAQLQREHVSFELECIDRMYLNAYVPLLPSESGIACSFRGHLGHRFASTKEAGLRQSSQSAAPAIEILRDALQLLGEHMIAEKLRALTCPRHTQHSRSCRRPAG